MIKISFIGHDTRNPNLGVGALTVSDIEVVRRISKSLGSEIQVKILIGNSARPCCVIGEDVSERIVRPLRRPLDFFSAVRDSDLVIDISGGDSFSDIYGGRRIFQILLQQYLVHIAGRPLVMAPQTMGPFRNGIWRRLAAGSVRRCEVVATRDAQSTAYLREMGIGRPIVEASDVALRLPYEAAATREVHDVPKVGLNVSALLMKGGYSGKNMFGLKADYPTLIKDVIRGFQSHPDKCELHLVGHVIPDQRGGVEDDFQACLDLASEFPGTVLAPPFKTPSEAKGYIAGLDFFLGARMHACIAAFSSGVPVVPMAYSRKFEGLFGTLGYNLTVDCTRDSGENIRARIFEAYADRAAIAVDMQGALRKGLEKLHGYEVELESVCRERFQDRL